MGVIQIWSWASWTSVEKSMTIDTTVDDLVNFQRYAARPLATSGPSEPGGC